MPKRYFLLPEECYGNIPDLYRNAAKISGYKITDKTRFDCRKIRVTAKVNDILWRYLLAFGFSEAEITALMLVYGPKANLEGDRYEFEIEDGFVLEED